METMTEQIIRLETTLKLAQQGYSIAQKGLSVIADFKKGDFDLHTVFFGSLQTVSPAIKGSAKAADILAMEIEIFLDCAKGLDEFTKSGVFSVSDIKYLSSVYNNLKDLTGKDVTELTDLLSDGLWQMTDDDRIHRIDLLYASVSKKLAFIRSFNTGVAQTAARNTREKAGLNNLLQLH